ncbi:MAG: hypothetical protein JJU37_08835 [Balneolaceae bacterium]|nr:hypothetical protein [Balneolaceae bacterium]
MMENYKNTQIGYFIILIFSVVLIIVFSVYTSGLLSESESIVLPVTLLFLIIFLINFSTLTVKVNRKEIIWYFGPGLWKFRIKVDEVKFAAITRAPIWEGVGIRWNPFRGMLYSVSGSYAVEIIRKNGKSTRIGTNEPRELLEAIQKSAGL